MVESFFSEFRNPDGSYKRYLKKYDEPSDFKDLLDEDLRDFVAGYFEKHPLDQLDISMPSEEPTWDPSTPPFPGLRAFTQEEALIFYGRGRETDELIDVLSKPNKRFIAVVGASGSGKSSLVAAGLLPALKNNAIHGSKDWVSVRFTPGEVGDNPFMALANGFKLIIEGHGRRPRDLAQDLEADSDALQEIVSMALDGTPDWVEVLIFIDQFEELFTLVDTKYLQPFVDLLVLMAKEARVRTVITMRADFYHRCLDWPVLDELLVGGQFTLLAPKIGELNEMITRPAERAGLHFEKGLPERILDDTGTEPGALALMAFALFELWQSLKESRKTLTHAAYDSFNGVHGAIGKRAEDTFTALKEKEGGLEAALARVFRELVEVDERGVATRRRAQLSQVADGAEAEVMVKTLTEARLLVTSQGEGNEAMVEVAHEAIFTNWPRIREWIEVRRDDLRLLRQVRLAAAEWEKQRCAAPFLWPHERLEFVSQMVERMRPNLSPLEEKFIRPESERWLNVIEDSATIPQQRMKIGDRLAEIGDPRRGVGIRADGLPDIVWCKVPGGKIILKKKAGTFSVDPFCIGKYPVSLIQYRRFLEAQDGYCDKRWWEGMAEREDEPGKQYQKLDNHPAENVSWYDAMAFCRWLTKRLGYGDEIRLPTEWEWQQAATGGDPASIYPWGANWDSNRANTRESRLSRTTAVGLYPEGASPVGALDMSGNVREWCQNEYENPNQIELNGKRRRSVRGGSWLNNHGLARCAARHYNHPDYRYFDLGFRVCCTSPIF
ncbi:MAG: SUMF1/EgtB/PvdO family nonheme iron enzyme [Desulfobacterales bacterium]|nr:MAG: SUMF1/EgtB/PvdO family nonheme iron enzyme [Desulfobacterales bacterium]